ncbi:hypothetical protein FHR81_003123 [Actinoalloteichus hoggarensis]|nr:hypothetical protein [Actinoalloteichus hoggarensis]
MSRIRAGPNNTAATTAVTVASRGPMTSFGGPAVRHPTGSVRHGGTGRRGEKQIAVLAEPRGLATTDAAGVWGRRSPSTADLRARPQRANDRTEAEALGGAA